MCPEASWELQWSGVTNSTDLLKRKPMTFTASVPSAQLYCNKWAAILDLRGLFTCGRVLARRCAGRLLTSEPWLHTRRGRALHYGEGCLRLCGATDQLRNLEEGWRVAMMKPRGSPSVRPPTSSSSPSPPPTSSSSPSPPPPSLSPISSLFPPLLLSPPPTAAFLSPTSLPSSPVSHLLPYFPPPPLSPNSTPSAHLLPLPRYPPPRSVSPPGTLSPAVPPPMAGSPP